MKYCKNCGQALLVRQKNNTFCSVECSKEYASKTTIQAWLNGEVSGARANGQISSTIRKYLIEQAGNKCELCGWNKINPTTGLVPLEIHHKDGNYLNNTRDNLQVLCPNCHSLTPNFKALNRTTRERTQVRKHYCIDCGVAVANGTIRCKKCESKNRTIPVEELPVTRDQLKKLIRTIPFTQIGKQFYVTDNTIRKWCIKYNLPSKKKDIANYTDSQWASL